MRFGAVTEAVPMCEVRKGDFLPGLDNGYVIESEAESDGYQWQLTMNDREGDEFYLIAPHDMPVSIKVPREPFVG